VRWGLIAVSRWRQQCATCLQQHACSSAAVCLQRLACRLRERQYACKQRQERWTPLKELSYLKRVVATHAHACCMRMGPWWAHVW
jgi:hypothetical protein